MSAQAKQDPAVAGKAYWTQARTAAAKTFWTPERKAEYKADASTFWTDARKAEFRQMLKDAA